MASNLNTKINSYAIEKGIEFDSAYSLTPTQTGTAASMTYVLTGTTPPSYESSVGPLGGSGSWKFATTTGSTGPGFGAPASMRTLLNDEDYSIGFWIKINTLPTGTGTSTIFNSTAIGSTNPGFTFSLGAASHSTVAGKLCVSAAGTSLSPLTTVTLGNWYYVAIVRTTNDSFKTYLNGSLVSTIQLNTTIAIANGPTFGPTISAPSNWSFNISNHYVAPTSVIDAAAIAEIWTAGSTSGATNITITETPATASALMTEPTIAVTIGDHTEITTSFIASIALPSNIVGGGDRNVNNVVDPMNSTSATIGDNVDVNAGSSTSFSSEAMLASALIVEPILAARAMTAQANMPDPTVDIQQTYDLLVKQLNPVIYINTDGTKTPTNQGSWGEWTITAASGTSVVPSTGKMAGVGSGKSWDLAASSGINFATQRTTSPFDTRIFDLHRSAAFTYEFWFNDRYDTSPGTFVTDMQSSTTGFSVSADRVSFNADRVYQVNYIQGYDSQGNPIIETGYGNEIFDFGVNYGASGNPYNRNEWNHIALTCEPTTGTPNTSSARMVIFKLWINGTLVKTSGALDWDNPANAYSNYLRFNATGNALVDEFAFYPVTLTNSQVINHFDIINNLTPDNSTYGEAQRASAEFGNHSFVVISNATPEIKEATASATFVNPSAIASQVTTISAEPMTASAENTSVTVSWGWTIYATPATAYAEEGPAYFLNDIYYQYIQANITPYRYVTFDASDAYLDYGTDNDYSVQPVVVGGTIVNPDLGINGKSAKTAGTSYITDGVILKESEWNDSWGTGQNSYHSSFWFQRASDDNSTTGLRVLWNLNGYKDNQHVVLYQYQNKLHMQFNNGSGTFIQQTTANTVNLFDYERHFIVVEFDHTNASHNTIRLYADATLVMTVDLGTYTGTTTNATSADSGANSETNNHPRLSVGCLITPFASTALPVIPSNTKLIIDEIYWDKNSITSTMVTNIYNYMPDKNNSSVSAEVMTASDEFVSPTLSVSSRLSVDALTASGELVDVTLITDREVIKSIEPLLADITFPAAKVFENKLINADVFVASAIFNNAGVKITIPGGPMIASIQLGPKIGALYYPPTYPSAQPVSYLFTNIPTMYVRYLIGKAKTKSIPIYKEIK